jgi:hypothetical protein
LEPTKEVQVLGFGIIAEVGKGYDVAFIDGAVFFCPKCYISF